MDDETVDGIGVTSLIAGVGMGCVSMIWLQTLPAIGIGLLVFLVVFFGFGYIVAQKEDEGE